MITRLRCLLGHKTAIVTEGDEGVIRCTRCPAVLDRWPLLRPERGLQAQRTHEALLRDRERRAENMTMPQRPKLLRMR